MSRDPDSVMADAGKAISLDEAVAGAVGALDVQLVPWDGDSELYSSDPVAPGWLHGLRLVVYLDPTAGKEEDPHPINFDVTAVHIPDKDAADAVQSEAADEIYRRLAAALPWRVVRVDANVDYVRDRPLRRTPAAS